MSAIEKKSNVRGAMEGGLSSVEDSVADQSGMKTDMDFSGKCNGVVLRVFLAAHRLPPSAMMRSEEIDA